MAALFDVSVPTVNAHLKNIFGSKELDERAVIRKFRTTAADGRIVNAYLDLAEDRAQRRIPMTMEDWAGQLDRFLELTERGILQNAGSISAEAARLHAESEFEKYRRVQESEYESDFDRLVKQATRAADAEDMAALERAERALEGKGRGKKK